jgi:hypothetical protein
MSGVPSRCRWIKNMKYRLILSLSLLTLMSLMFACGGTPNTNNSNANRTNTVANSTSNSNNTTFNVSNATSNSTYPTNSANKPANAATNTAANKLAANTANTAANKVATTQKPPKGATAVCKDGTYSFSTTDSGQCSGHGGVEKKL